MRIQQGALSESRLQRIELFDTGTTKYLLRDTKALRLRGDEGGPLKIVASELLTAGTSVRIDDCYDSPMIRVRCSERPFEGRYLIESDSVTKGKGEPPDPPISHRVIYFGLDECHRVAVLRCAGYEVKESPRLEELGLDLQHHERVDVVIVSGNDPRIAEQAAELVRRNCAAPLILFRRREARIDESKFDRVFSSFVQPQVWLNETAALIEHGRPGKHARDRYRGLRIQESDK